MPVEWMPAGTLRFPGQRRRDPARAGVPADPAHAAFRDECVRRAMFALWLPKNGRTGLKEVGPATWRQRTSAFLRLAEWQFENRPSSDGSVFGALTLADILTGLYPAKKCTPDMRRDYEAMLATLLDMGDRKVISDYPAFFSRRPDPQGGAVPETLMRDAEVLKPSAPAAESEVQPFPDDFVTEFLRRAMWIQDNVADRLLDALERDLDVAKKYAHRTGPDTEAVKKERLAAILDGDWSDGKGKPLPRLLYPIRQVVPGDPETMSTAWPPRNLKSFNIACGILQGCDLGVVNACTGARSSEVLAAKDVPLGELRDRYYSRTFKLVEEIGGKERDWPLHPVAVRAVEIQSRLSRLLRPEGTDHLWVAMKGDHGPLNSANSSFGRTVGYLGLSGLLGDGSSHVHRWRHTVARLVALSIVGAPKVLFDLFGHKNVEMTLHYMMSSPDIADEAMKVAKETTYAMVQEAVVEALDERTSGAASEGLREHLPKAMRLGEEVYDTENLRKTAEILSFDGTCWALVREGVICTKGPGQYGPCTKGRGMPDPGACRTSCEFRLETAAAERQCEETVVALVRERAGAAAEGMEMVVANLDGQIVAELNRWDGVRARILAAHPEIVALWEASAK